MTAVVAITNFEQLQEKARADAALKAKEPFNAAKWIEAAEAVGYKVVLGPSNYYLYTADEKASDGYAPTYVMAWLNFAKRDQGAAVTDAIMAEAARRAEPGVAPPCPWPDKPSWVRAWKRVHRGPFVALEFLAEWEAAGGKFFDATPTYFDKTRVAETHLIFAVPRDKEASEYLHIWLNLADRRKEVSELVRNSTRWAHLESMPVTLKR